jgi:hypothetical protein
MIFLGAGASVIFGIKTMQGLTDDLVSAMKGAGHGEIIDKIINSLTRFGLVPDFESIYTTLEALTAPEEAVRNSGSFTAYIANTCKGFEEIKAHAEFSQVLSDLRGLIYDSCTIRPPQLIEKNREILNRLFAVCRSQKENRHLSSLIGYWTGGGPSNELSLDVGKTIVTTNYDMAMELYHSLVEKPLNDGFRPTNNRFVMEFDPTSYSGENRRSTGNTWLLKLHGSIWQFRQGDRIIKTIDDPKKSPLDIKIDEQMMIYPVGEKPILREPYYFFYELFKEQRWRRLIAIGYSFRDAPVNIAIIENLQRVKDSSLIVVNPKADAVISNLGSWAKTYDNRIIRIPCGFGDEKLWEDLDLALRVDNWSRYKDRKREEELRRYSQGAAI